MNRYPVWKYVLVVLAVVFGFIYTLPNFFGESPAVQVSSVKATLKVDLKTLERAEATLKTAGIANNGIFLDANGVKARLNDTDTQLKAKDILEKEFNPDATDPQYVVALNLLSSSPQWLTNLHALPMYLGLDLRGGVHFLLQVDMKGALTKRLDSTAADLRSLMRDKNIRHGGINREGERIVVRFRDEDTRDKARGILQSNQPDLLLADQGEGTDLRNHSTRPSDAALKCILAMVLPPAESIAACNSGRFWPSLSGFCAVPQTGTSMMRAMRASRSALATTISFSKITGIRRAW